MTCGGKNHRSNCDCPIGRVGSATPVRDKRTELDLFSFRHVPPLRIKPIIRCPVCSKSVFFCALPNEGRVYFDEIGSPWTKHSCTDKLSSFNQGALDSGKDAWSSVDNVIVESAEPGAIRLAGFLRGKDFVAFIRIDSLSDRRDPENHLRQSFLHARIRHNGDSDLVLLTPELRPELIPSFACAARAEKYLAMANDLGYSLTNQ